MHPFELKGRTAALTVLRLATSQLAHIEAGLAARVESSPGFFKNSLCMIDLEGLECPEGSVSDPGAVDILGLVALLRGVGIVPVLLKGGNQNQQALAIGCGLGAVQDEPPLARLAAAAPQTTAPAAKPTCLVVRQHVRAGQRIYARGGDLVVIGSVNPGAEVIADDSIHVYGALRGRAMAGAQGNENGRIFCQQFHAELLAVAGVYCTSEELDPALAGRQVQAYLQAEQLLIESLEAKSAA